MTPRVSVLMPCFNCASTVDEATASIVTQSWHDLELIAVDDGATGATAAKRGGRGPPRRGGRGFPPLPRLAQQPRHAGRDRPPDLRRKSHGPSIGDGAARLALAPPRAPGPMPGR